ncbi:hypothetical protein BO86DRAFT_406404 [Aspergillus japonicus CBS 114.51]|uniref:C2H2-type domain-containing protein n=1 Tax=Aspergillus japonicus CBS 114.51 TaxID=1448312 RepID=A0A8T8XCH4_ASPJA|nr:hypothetical protein BO86DRAFT_406404 [Aspergillus japonicus CBS 114.51]RAH85953.1 hypothetical protein BO86DRAFT_406404 [Aspergillus japonicus CBS 114.51]
MTTLPTTTKPAASPSKFKCVCCKKKSFKTAEALRDHQRARDHHPVACPLCPKVFCDKHAVQQHQQVHQRKAAAAATTALKQGPTGQQQTTTTTPKQQTNPPTTTPSKPQTTTPPPNIPRTHHHPSILHPLEQDLLYKYLLARCHPRTRLQAQNYPTAQAPGIDQKPTPPANPTQPRRRAVVLTCETEPHATSSTHLTATDFLTNEALLHLELALGSAEGMQTAAATTTTTTTTTAAAAACTDKTTRATVSGAGAARTALWEVIDADTVLVGYGLQRGLQLLRMGHERVVDAGILTAEAVFLERSVVPVRRVWGLGELCGEMLGWEAAAPAAPAAPAPTKKGKRKKGACDGWEGCVGAREVVVWCLRNPELLRAWAEGKADGDPPTSETAKSKRRKNKKKSKSKKRTPKKDGPDEPTLLTTASPKPETTPTLEPPPQPEEPDEDEDSDEGLEIVQWQDLE